MADKPDTAKRKQPLSQTALADSGPEMPDIRDSEGESEHAAIKFPPKKGARNFNPIEIRGKPLSQTVIEDRGPEMPAPEKRKAEYPPGEFSPTIYPEEVDEAAMRRAFDFKPVKIRGKPLSQTVIEERLSGW